jgi:hypothetical protein
MPLRRLPNSKKDLKKNFYSETDFFQAIYRLIPSLRYQLLHQLKTSSLIKFYVYIDNILIVYILLADFFLCFEEKILFLFPGLRQKLNKVYLYLSSQKRMAEKLISQQDRNFSESLTVLNQLLLCFEYLATCHSLKIGLQTLLPALSSKQKHYPKLFLKWLEKIVDDLSDESDVEVVEIGFSERKEGFLHASEYQDEQDLENLGNDENSSFTRIYTGRRHREIRVYKNLLELLPDLYKYFKPVSDKNELNRNIRRLIGGPKPSLRPTFRRDKFITDTYKDLIKQDFIDYGWERAPNLQTQPLSFFEALKQIRQDNHVKFIKELSKLNLVDIVDNNLVFSDDIYEAGIAVTICYQALGQNKENQIIFPEVESESTLNSLIVDFNSFFVSQLLSSRSNIQESLAYTLEKTLAQTRTAAQTLEFRNLENIVACFWIEFEAIPIANLGTETQTKKYAQKIYKEYKELDQKTNLEKIIVCQAKGYIFCPSKLHIKSLLQEISKKFPETDQMTVCQLWQNDLLEAETLEKRNQLISELFQDRVINSYIQEIINKPRFVLEARLPHETLVSNVQDTLAVDPSFFSPYARWIGFHPQTNAFETEVSLIRYWRVFLNFMKRKKEIPIPRVLLNKIHFLLEKMLKTDYQMTEQEKTIYGNLLQIIGTYQKNE